MSESKDSIQSTETEVPAAGGVEIRVARVLTISRIGDDDEAMYAEATGNERIECLDALRRQTAKDLGYVYPERLQRVLEVAERE